MYTYQVRKSSLYCRNSIDSARLDSLNYPQMAQVQLDWSPRKTFGEHIENRQSFASTQMQDAFLGVDLTNNFTELSRSYPKAPISVKVGSVADRVLLEFKGSTLLIEAMITSRKGLTTMIQVYTYHLSALLSIEIEDAPVAVKVRGRIAGIPFAWGPVAHNPETRQTDQNLASEDDVEKYVSNALEYLSWIHTEQSAQCIQLLAVSSYLQKAARLRRLSERRWEFVAEEILNFYRILNALFPWKEGKSMNTTRRELTKLGFPEVEIEALYIPAIVLRNQGDVAHVQLQPPEGEGRDLVCEYADIAEGAFRKLLQVVAQKLMSKEYSIQVGSTTTAADSKKEPVERLKSAFDAYRMTM